MTDRTGTSLTVFIGRPRLDVKQFLCRSFPVAARIHGQLGAK